MTRQAIVGKQLNLNLSRKVDFSSKKKESKILIKTKVEEESVIGLDSVWNKCSYFVKSDEAFYIKGFLDTGQFAIGQQMFVDNLNNTVV